jgi:DNA-binding HxlR family transcriptional regulator
LLDRTERGSYGQFCPVAMAAEIFCNRWTALVLRELLCGTTRFNDLRRGVPRMSPTLLSKRLKELEVAGVITATTTNQPGVMDYRPTEAGEDLRPIIMSLGFWGQRWVESTLSLKNLDPGLLMWDMRRNLQPSRCRRAAPPSISSIRISGPTGNHGGWWSTTKRSISASPIPATRSICMSAARCAP